MPRNNPTPSSEIISKRYGRLTVIREALKSERRRPRDRSFVCKCDCGTDYIGTAHQLLHGDVVSCGCAQTERRHKHGHTTLTTQSRVYGIWHSMLQRTTNPNASNYHNYGGRGITVDERWLDFSNFLADMGEPPSEKHTLDRIDNELGYSKENCQWADWTTQMRHTRQNHLITFKEQTLCITEWAEKTGLTHKIISYRLSAGWSVEDILTTPLVPRSQIRTWKSRK